jgi:hypothetical protein
MPLSSSITDKPIGSIAEDRLKAARYASALSQFIADSSTPLTVGLQGEWGTGKTSMMYMLREHFQTMNIATSWVNTWEYSMFRGAQETTPAILQAMLDKLKITCEEQGLWTVGDEADQRMKKVGRFLSSIANQAVASHTGLDVKGALSGSESAPVSSEIAEVKADISGIIGRLIGDKANPYQRVVFFVDDLDRIPPGDAVEVLEALKNIFDIPFCIFVLAIDYDVVVKGLESKFGPKTEENEREFRSFFDKIIQVPFSMPTGAYTIDELLISKLEGLGITIPEEQRQDYTRVVNYTVGFNPRSLKRYMNSFSLLRRLRDADYLADPDDFGEKPDQNDDFVMFVLLGLQISYPKIFRILVKDVQFLDWDSGFAFKQGVDLAEVSLVTDAFDDSVKDKTDETWEKLLYGFCNRDIGGGKADAYLKAKWESIIDLFELLRTRYVSGKGKSQDTEGLYDLLSRSISFAAITNVDDDVESKASGERKRNKVMRFDDVSGKYQVLLADGKTNQDALPAWRVMAQGLEELAATEACALSVTASQVTLRSPGGNALVNLWNPDKKKPVISMYFYKKDESPIPRSEGEVEMAPAGKATHRYKVTVGSEAGVVRALKIVRQGILELG